MAVQHLQAAERGVRHRQLATVAHRFRECDGFSGCAPGLWPVVGKRGRLRKERQSGRRGEIVASLPPQRRRLGGGLIRLGMVIDEVQGLRQRLDQRGPRVRREAVGKAKRALELCNGLAVRARGKRSLPGR